MATFREMRNGIVAAGVYDIIKFVVFLGLLPGSVVTATLWLAWEWIRNLHPLYIATSGLVCTVAVGWCILGWLQWRRGRSAVEVSAGTQSAVQRGQPYNQAWLDGNAWNLWTVASLWEGVEPRLPQVHTTKSYARMKVLEGDIKLGILPMLESTEKEMAWWIVTRDALVEYVNKQRISPRPRFLFPNG